MQAAQPQPFAPTKRKRANYFGILNCNFDFLSLNFDIVVAVGLDEVVHVLLLEPAVAPGAQAIDRKKSSVRPVPHCIGMNMEELRYLSGGQHT